MLRSARFKDRTRTAQILAEKLEHYANRHVVAVLALSRGGLPESYEVATPLCPRLKIFRVRKLDSPRHEEFAMRAIDSGRLWFVNDVVTRELNLSQPQIQQIAERKEREMERRAEVCELLKWLKNNSSPRPFHLCGLLFFKRRF